MENARSRRGSNFPMDLYKEKLQEIEFMKPFLMEADIFIVGSTKFKEFLIRCITQIHTDFHYLSFISIDDVDQDLIRALRVLQVLPMTLKKNKASFDNWSENDICNFWTKFISLCCIQFSENFEPQHSFAFDSKTTFLKDIKNAEQYLNYNFPAFHAKNIMDVDLNEEINKWNNGTCLELNDTIHEAVIEDCETELLFKMNTEKLISDLEYIVATFSHFKSNENFTKKDDCKLFQNLINLTKNVFKFREDYNAIKFNQLNELVDEYKIVRDKYDLSNNLYFIKTYGNLVSVLDSKINLNM